MEVKTNLLNAETILKKVFTPDVKGYDCDEVDTFLDRILQDYLAMEQYYAEANGYIRDLESQLRKAKETINQLTLDNARMRQRLVGVTDSTDVNSSNIELINRIAKLETALYKLGGNPKSIE